MLEVLAQALECLQLRGDFSQLLLRLGDFHRLATSGNDALGLVLLGVAIWGVGFLLFRLSGATATIATIGLGVRRIWTCRSVTSKRPVAPSSDL